MTDWLWEKRECTEQKEIYELYYRDKLRNKHISNEEHDRRYVQKIKKVRYPKVLSYSQCTYNFFLILGS